MKILVISDTHHNLYFAQRAIDYAIQEGVDEVIHCGDHIGDAQILSKNNPKLKIHGVRGNCDWGEKGEDELLLELEGVKCLVVHGHKQDVKYSYEDLYIDGAAYEANLVLFGHSHIAHKETKNTISILNPGSIAQPRDTQFPSFAIVEIECSNVCKMSILQIQGVGEIVPHPSYI